MTDAREDIQEISAWLQGQCMSHPNADLTANSRRVKAGDIFVAIKGAVSDGLDYAEDVKARGAVALLCEERSDANEKCAGLPHFQVKNLAAHLGEIADAFYAHPTQKMFGIAVTGTNGKTSTSHWIAEALTCLEKSCAAIGTIGAFLAGRRFEVPCLTTPDAVSLQALFHELSQAGAQAFAMEASSIGLVQGRMAGTRLDTAVFTNLTRDHLDYHKTFEAYEAAKATLFDWPGLKHAVININDAAGVRMVNQCLAKGVEVVAYGIEHDWESLTVAEGAKPLIARKVEAAPGGMQYELLWQGESYPVEVSVLGEFNVANMLATTGTLLTAGFEMPAILEVIRTIRAPKGRLETVSLEGVDAQDLPLVVVDYAHTPDALEKAVRALHPVARVRGGKVTTVFGAGGNRDPGKRPMMGEVAARTSDSVIVTSDNPRNEDPELIARDVASGVARHKAPVVILDRREAIIYAVQQADVKDIILIAGKGHEDYQEICGVKHHFDDAQEALAALKRRVEGV